MIILQQYPPRLQTLQLGTLRQQTPRQQSPQLPISLPQIPEREKSPPQMPKAPKTTRKQWQPIDELQIFYDLTGQQGDITLGYLLQVQQDYFRYYKALGLPPLTEQEYLRQLTYQYNLYYAAKGKQWAKQTFREWLGQAMSSVLAAVLPALGSAYDIQTL